MGYTNVAVYNEGLPEWVKRGYPAELKKVYPAAEIPLVSAVELKQLVDARRVLVLDIRDDDDRVAGTIPGARPMDLEVLDERVGELPKDAKIVLVDLHGKQTQIAGRFLLSRGHRDVSRLDGGFIGGWIQAGFAAAR
jgi:rhodanese-related sulfurtransferase